MKKDFLYYLLDSRAGIAATDTSKTNLNDIDEDWERFILVADADKYEICEDANSGDYGANCIVANSKGYIFWEWYNEDGKWKPTK